MSAAPPDEKASKACSATCGIMKERDRQKAQAREAARLQRDVVDRAVPFDPSEVDALATTLEALLPTRVFISNEGDGVALWLLCGLHDNSLWEVREGVVTGDPSRDEETYVRVALSSAGRFATLREVHLRALRDNDGLCIEEHTLAGIVDRRLPLFVKATQGLLRKQRIVALDAAFLEEPVSADPSRSLSDALFADAQPGSIRATYLPRGL